MTYSVLHEGPLPHVLGNMDERHRLEQLQGSAAAAPAVPPAASSDRINQASAVTPFCIHASAKREHTRTESFVTKRKHTSTQSFFCFRGLCFFFFFFPVFFAFEGIFVCFYRFVHSPVYPWVSGSACFIFATC